MADIRMHEGWAMAHWLQRTEVYDYPIDSSARLNRLLYWEDDGALTRAWPEDDIDEGARELATDVPSSDHVVFIAAEHRNENVWAVTAFRYSLGDIPFSHYFRDTGHAPQTLAIDYSPPRRDGSEDDAATLRPTPPHSMKLLGIVTTTPESSVTARYASKQVTLEPENRRRKIGEFSTAQINASDAASFEVSG